ncbi:hypothetical protein EYF80_012226 [Liparis tanakae]|uniref:Uncharacterized protein n=1 Tax=Liparis tanakae TaxID=230148 RepID=A0A4Z2II78_9TELE|nr:hypothetical protein EYF80_012226 [Liparis tanakae]
MGVAPESVNPGMEWLSMGETARWRISGSPLRQEGEGYHRGRKGVSYSSLTPLSSSPSFLTCSSRASSSLRREPFETQHMLTLLMCATHRSSRLAWRLPVGTSLAEDVSDDSSIEESVDSAESSHCLYLLSLLLLLFLLHALFDLTQQAGRVRGETVEAVLLRQLLQPSGQLPVGHLNLLELQLALSSFWRDCLSSTSVLSRRSSTVFCSSSLSSSVACTRRSSSIFRSDSILI